METNVAVEQAGEATAADDLKVAAGIEPAPTRVSDDELVVEDLLVEDVSIDGMCGVY